MEITLYPWEDALSEIYYLVPFAIKNESDITFNMVSMRFNGHSLTIDAPGDITEAPKGTDYVFDTIAGLENLPFLYDGDSVTIRELFPGESLSGIYTTVFDVDADPDKVYYELRDMFTQTLDGSTVNIPVIIEPIVVDKPVKEDPELFDWLKDAIKDGADFMLPYACDYWYLNLDELGAEDREMLLLGLMCGIDDILISGLGSFITDIPPASDYYDDPVFLQGKIFADAYFAYWYASLEPMNSIIEVLDLPVLSNSALEDALNQSKTKTQRNAGVAQAPSDALGGSSVNPEVLKDLLKKIADAIAAAAPGTTGLTGAAGAAEAAAVLAKLSLYAVGAVEIVIITEASLSIRATQILCDDYDRYAAAMAATAAELEGIAGKYDNFKCKEALEEMTDYLTRNNQRFEIISIQYPPYPGFVVSTIHGGNDAISKNGFHTGMLYNGLVFCNVHPYGLPLPIWLNDFQGLGKCVVIPSKYQNLKIQ